MKFRAPNLLALASGLAIAAVVLAACTSAAGVSSTGKQVLASESKSGADTKGEGFAETPVGDEVDIEGLRIRAVYFQPVDMEPADKVGIKAADADVHLEADIHALEDNKTGFGSGEWIPYLTIKYTLKNLDTGKDQDGSFMPMNASDGPHYGANVKMMGAGKYKLSFAIDSPAKQNFLLHVDKATGVEGRFWNKALETSWEFNYLPRKF